MTGYLIHEEDVPLLHATMRGFRNGSRNPPPTAKGKQPPPNRPPIVAILLEDLPSGGTADAAVLYLEETNETQMVTMEGEIIGGFFQLRFRPKENAAEEVTGEIPFNATADEVRKALEALSSINSGDVGVSLDEDIGRWFVTFTGQYADQDLPLMRATNGLTSNLGAVIVAATTFWEDTGTAVKVFGIF